MICNSFAVRFVILNKNAPFYFMKSCEKYTHPLKIKHNSNTSIPTFLCIIAMVKAWHT